MNPIQKGLDCHVILLICWDYYERRISSTRVVFFVSALPNLEELHSFGQTCTTEMQPFVPTNHKETGSGSKFLEQRSKMDRADLYDLKA